MSAKRCRLTVLPQVKSLTIKLSAKLSARVSRLARARNVSQSDVVRAAIEAYGANQKGSVGEAAAALRGSLKGLPRDLSSNRKHLDGYGR